MSYLKVKRRATSRININDFLRGINTAYDESVLSPSVAAGCYNFDFTSGALKGCEGFYDFGINAESVWVYRSDSAKKKYLMYTLGGDIFYYDGEAFGKLEGIKLTSLPKAITYRLYGEDVVLICSPTDNMVVWNGVDPAYYVSSSPLVTSMTVHYERMFVTTSDQPNTLWFSDDLDPTNWNTDMTEGGFIELADERGALIKVLSFLNYVYIFREKGISRLTAYAEQSEFSVSHLFVTNGRIYPESIALCGDRVIFASSDGLFTFDGVSTRRILTNLNGLLKPDESSVGVYHNGKYYLSFTADFEDKSDYAILIYGDDGYTLMRGLDVEAFFSDGDLYAIMSDRLYKMGGENPLPKKWTMAKTDLGSGRMKKIKTLYIDTATDITVTIDLDGKQKSFSVKGKNTTSRVFINMCGRKMGMSISCSNSYPRISRPQLTLSYMDS